MVRGKTRPKRKAVTGRKKSIRLKSSSSRARRTRKRSVAPKTGFEGLLDKQVSVGDILKYSGIAAAFVIVITFVFIMGRLSAIDNLADSTDKITGSSKQTLKSTSVDTSDEEELTDGDNAESENDSSVEVALSADEFDEDPAEYVYETAPVVSRDIELEEEEEPSCKAKDAEFDYDYKDVVISVSNFQTEKKGDNWATINSLKLSITNNEDCVIINPTQIKLKLNNKGKGSTWWDDEVFLSDSFTHIRPGESVTEIVPVHVSYADIYMEKDFKLIVLDDYGIEIGAYKKYLTLG